jgi:allophanate hydrolase
MNESMQNKSIKVAVCGAHMQGLPLNPQLTALGGEFVQATTTTADYQLFALNSFTPPRPGLLRVLENGTAIALEIWQLPIENYGKFVASVPSPLGFGTLTLIDGSTVQGFLCEAYATQNAADISHLGGWRNYLGAIKET